MKDKSLNITNLPLSYPKYQYSIFLKNGREEQVVIRSDNWEDFLKAKKKVDIIIKGREIDEPPVPVQPVVQPAPQPEASRWCNMHNVQMTQAISKNTGKPYFSHRNEQGQICFGGGYS